MNKKYERYIEYIADDVEPPYFEDMRDAYGLSEKEYEMVLSKVFNQPVTIEGRYVYNTNGDEIYREMDSGLWIKTEYDDYGNETYYEDSNGFWERWEYNTNGNIIYYEDSDGNWYKI